MIPRVLALLLCMALLGLSGPAAAQTGVAGRPLSVCLLPDRGGEAPARLIQTPARFDCTTRQHALGPGSFWVISEDLQAPPAHALTIRVASLWQQQLSTYILYADGTIRWHATGPTGLTPLIQLGAVAELPIPARSAAPVRILWHVRNAANVRGVLMGARLATAEEGRRANLAMAALYSGFAGMCLALIVYNLALYVALRHPFQLRYCVMIGLLLAYTISSSGALAWAFPGIDNNFRLRINYALLGLTGGAAIGFARSFFEPRVFAGWLGRWATIIGAAMVGAGLLVAVSPRLAIPLADAIFSAAFLGITTVVLPTMWRAWRTRSNFLWLFALGWGVPILAAALRTLSNLHVLPWSFWLDNSTILSMMVEALTSALVVAYRIKLLRDERDEAIASEVMARRLADTDPLTGLLNRRAFLKAAIGRESDQTLLILDIDHFKAVNETLGHDGGDEVLRQFARMVRSCLPLGAIAARMGGEEFAVLVDAATPVDPEAILARLRTMRTPFDLRVTASIGVCRGPLRDDRDWRLLYRGADAALFEAKAAGRDRARHARLSAA